jgi:hypothetical protein
MVLGSFFVTQILSLVIASSKTINPIFERSEFSMASGHFVNCRDNATNISGESINVLGVRRYFFSQRRSRAKLSLSTLT